MNKLGKSRPFGIQITFTVSDFHYDWLYTANYFCSAIGKHDTS